MSERRAQWVNQTLYTFDVPLKFTAEIKMSAAKDSGIKMMMMHINKSGVDVLLWPEDAVEVGQYCPHPAPHPQSYRGSVESVVTG